VGVASAPMVNVAGFYKPWSVISSLPATSTLIADGALGKDYPTCSAAPVDVPLTTEFDVGTCGRVVYSSYHTLSTVNTSNLSAQEKIMEYLIFAAADCRN
jgi:hypothetical protein